MSAYRTAAQRRGERWLFIFVSLGLCVWAGSLAAHSGSPVRNGLTYATLAFSGVLLAMAPQTAFGRSMNERIGSTAKTLTQGSAWLILPAVLIYVVFTCAVVFFPLFAAGFVFHPQFTDRIGIDLKVGLLLELAAMRVVHTFMEKK